MPGIVPPSSATQLQNAEAQKEFSNAVAAATGIDPRVIYSQAEIEGAYASGGTGGFNFLNLATGTVTSLGDQYSSSSPKGFAQFANLQQAEKATIDEFKSPTITIGTGTANPPGQTPQSQISQIGNSPWDAGHYGSPAGSRLATEFTALFGKSALVSSAQSSPITTTGAGGDTGSPSTATGSLTSGITSAVTGPLDSIENAVKFVFSYRFLEIIGGGALILVGLVGLMKEIGVSVPAPGPVGKAAAAVG